MTTEEHKQVGALVKENAVSLFTGPFDSSLHSYDYRPKGVPVVPTEAIERRILKTEKCPHIEPAKAQELARYRLRAGDICFARRGAQATGLSALVREEQEDWIAGTGIIIFRIHDASLSPEYFSFAFTSQESIRWLKAHAVGAVMPNLNSDVIAGLSLRLPPLPEQHAIAHILGTLDDKIELNRRMNETLEGMARAIFKSWFVDFDPVRAKAEGRQPSGMDAETAHLPPEVAALFPDSFQDSEFGKIPKGWEVSALDECVSLIIDYRGKTPKKLGSDWSDGGIPAISAKNIKRGRLVQMDKFKFVDDELYTKWMKDELAPGDILLTSEAPLGELLYLADETKYCLSQRVFGIRSSPGVCESTYLYHWLSHAEVQDELESRSTGTTVVGIRQSELRKVHVLLPAFAVQRVAARRFLPLMLRIHANQREAGTLATLRDTLLPKLLSGEIRVKDAERLVEQVGDGAGPETVEELGEMVKPRERGQAVVASDAPGSIDEVDRDEIMAAFRQACRGRGWMSREELLKDVSARLGYGRLGANIKTALKGHLRAAIRRRIVAADGQLAGQDTADMNAYTRDELQHMFKSVIRPNQTMTREELYKATAQHLGFQRFTETIRAPLKSALNGAIRKGILAYEGSEVWRKRRK